MEQTWESLFSEQAKIEGHSQQYISECLAYAGILQSHNVPVIFDKWHFFSFFPDIKKERMEMFLLDEMVHHDNLNPAIHQHQFL